MKKIFELLFVLVFISSPVFSQNMWMSMDISFGGQFPNYQNLDNELSKLEFNKTPAALTGAGMWVEFGNNKLLFEMGGMFSSSSTNKIFENEDTELNVSGSSGTFSVGYKFDLYNGFFFYPKIGVTGGSYNFLLSSKTDISSNFLTVIDSVRTQQSITNYYNELIIGGIFLFPFGDVSHFGLDFMFGLPPFKDKWYYNDKLLSNTPKSNPALFSLNLRLIFYLTKRGVNR